MSCSQNLVSSSPTVTLPGLALLFFQVRCLSCSLDCCTWSGDLGLFLTLSCPEIGSPACHWWQGVGEKTCFFYPCHPLAHLGCGGGCSPALTPTGMAFLRPTNRFSSSALHRPDAMPSPLCAVADKRQGQFSHSCGPEASSLTCIRWEVVR